MKALKVCVVTGTRAEYGLLYWILRGLKEAPEFQLQLIATGTHLSPEHGETYRAIEQDGFTIDEKFDIELKSDTPAGIARSMGLATERLAGAYERLKPDLLLLLGDRYEILAAAQAALVAKLPIAHIAGGDVTEGAFDEAIRHSITKMSHLHFVTNEQAARRVRQLGEDSRSIFQVGSPGLDTLLRTKLMDREALGRDLGFRWRRKNLLITFHPVTLDDVSSDQQLNELFQALDRLGDDFGLILTLPNADTGGRGMIRQIERFVATHPNAKAYPSLGQVRYLSALSLVDAIVGNSSSGLYEAPSFRKPTVNIGDRQKGRVQANSVLNCAPRSEEIYETIQKALSWDCSQVINPYGDGDASEKILSVLRQVGDPRTLVKKRFFDLCPEPTRSRVYVIAEAGVNHNGSLEMALKLIDVAAEAGADAVKFQTFKAKKLVSKSAKKAEYQIQTTGAAETQLQMIQKLELCDDAHRELLAHCRKRGIEFLSTPFDSESLEFLVDRLGMSRVKVPSGEVTNGPFLLEIARKGLPIIFSTGMSRLEEVRQALSVLAFGFRKTGETPSPEAFEKSFVSMEGQKALKEKVVLLHCTTEYPTPFGEINLRAIDTLREVFGLEVGFSDHSEGISVPTAAVARGARLIEKHFTLDRSLPGPDHRASLEPEELRAMIRAIREVERALGSPAKAPTASEKKNLPIARKSLVAARNIARGEVFTAQNITVKRPGNGLSPMLFWETLGKKAQRDYQEDELI